MLKSLYTTATGMKAQQTMVDMIANNIANVNTAGFKKSQASFEDLLYVSLQSPGLGRGSGDNPVPIGTQIGSGTRLNGTTKVFTTGTLEITDRNLDVAIDGEGFFAVTLPDEASHGEATLIPSAVGSPRPKPNLPTVARRRRRLSASAPYSALRRIVAVSRPVTMMPWQRVTKLLN